MCINLILVLKEYSSHIISFIYKFPLCQGDYNLKQRIKKNKLKSILHFYPTTCMHLPAVQPIIPIHFRKIELKVAAVSVKWSIWCLSATICNMLSFSSGKVLYRSHGPGAFKPVEVGNVLFYQLSGLSGGQTYDIKVTSRFSSFGAGKQPRFCAPVD